MAHDRLKPALRALLWAAVSSKPQAEKDSLPEQLADARAYADRMGWRVVGALEVPGHTRDYIFYADAAADMPAYAELQYLAGERAFDVLVCRGRDRLGRTDALIAQVEAVVAQAGAQVLSLAMPQPMGQHDRGALYVAAIERAGAQAEIVELRRRHSSGMRGRTLRGLPPGLVPYPYVTQNDGAVVLDADKLRAARRIYELLVVERWSYDRVIRQLHDERIPAARTEYWCGAALRNLLANSFLRGVVRYGDLTAPHNFPVVFTPEETDAIDAELDRRRKLRRGATSPRAWTGIVVCARCGWHMASMQTRGRIAYRCSRHIDGGRRGLNECHGNYTQLERITAAAEYALRLYTDRAVLEAALEEMEGGQHERLEAALADADAAMERLTTERSRLTTIYLRGTITLEEYEAQMASLAGALAQQKQTATEARRALAQCADPAMRIDELAAAIPGLLHDLTHNRADRATLAGVFRAIYCDGGQVVRITFR